MPRTLDLQIEVQVDTDADLFRDKVAAVLMEHAQDLLDRKKDLPASGCRDYRNGSLEWYAKIDGAKAG